MSLVVVAVLEEELLRIEREMVSQIRRRDEAIAALEYLASHRDAATHLVTSFGKEQERRRRAGLCQDCAGPRHPRSGRRCSGCYKAEVARRRANKSLKATSDA